jgi:hypothetical protein
MYYNVTFLYPCTFPLHLPHCHNLQELVPLTLPTFITLVSLALVTDCYVVIIVPRHPHPLTLSLNAVFLLRYRPHFLLPSKGAAPSRRCTGAAGADTIAVAVAGNCGALIRIGEQRPSVGGIINHDGSNVVVLLMMPNSQTHCLPTVVSSNVRILLPLMVAMTSPGATRIVDHDGSDGGGPPDDAKLSNLFPPNHGVLQRAHLPSVDGCNDLARRNPHH